MRFRSAHALFLLLTVFFIALWIDPTGPFRGHGGGWTADQRRFMLISVPVVAVLAIIGILKQSYFDFKYGRYASYPFTFVHKRVGHIPIHGRGQCVVAYRWMRPGQLEQRGLGTERFKRTSSKLFVQHLYGGMRHADPLNDNDRKWQDVVVTERGRWELRICFSICTGSDREHDAGIAIRVRGAVRALHLPADIVIEESGPSLGFSVVVPEE